MDEDMIRISRDVEDDLDMVYIPGIHNLDAQAGSVEFGVDRETLVNLHRYLGLWLDATKGLDP